MRARKWAVLLAGAVAITAGTSTAALGIVGGEAVPSVPSWMGSLQVGDSHVCGSALVAPTWAVTAKHCLESTLTQVRLGSHVWTSGGELAGVADVVPGPDATDLALLRLDHAVAATPVNIATSTPEAGTTVTLLGYGQTTPQSGSALEPDLKQLQTEILTDSLCAQQGLNINDAGELCVEATLNASACFGDSGGPAVVDDALVGITSRSGSSTCGVTNVIYTDVTALRSWIASTTGTAGTAAGWQPSDHPGTAAPGTPAQPPRTPLPPASPIPPALPTPPTPAATPTASPVTGSTSGGTLTGLRLRGSAWRVFSPSGVLVAIAYGGDVVSVDCQIVGPTVHVPRYGTSRLWDHIPGRGFISDLAVSGTPHVTSDPRLPSCHVSR